MWGYIAKVSHEKFEQERFQDWARQCLLFAQPLEEFCLERPSFASFAIPEATFSSKKTTAPEEGGTEEVSQREEYLT
eukprot:3551147-Prorocentrum_lima.AAC.1